GRRAALPRRPRPGRRLEPRYIAGHMARQGHTPGDTGRALGLVGPATFWLIVFFLLPLVFVAVASFMSRGSGGAPVPPITLDQYTRTFTVFGPVIWRSLQVAAITTVLSLLFGYP